MKAISVRAAGVAAIILLFVCVAGAQQPEAERKPAPQLTTDDVAPRGQAGVGVSGTLALLPPSDLIAVLDVGRILDALLPKLREMAPTEVAKMTKEMDEFTSKTGIDPFKIRTAVIGVRLPNGNFKGSGAVIFQGLELDPQKLAAVMKTATGEIKLLTHQGKPFFVISRPKDKAPSATLPGMGIEEIAFAPLGQQGVVIGDAGSVKSMLEAPSGSDQAGSNALLGEALQETSPSGWIRFAANLSDSFRQELKKQGSAFGPFAAVKVLSGSLSFDGADGSAATLDLKMRTSSSDEAAKLESHLKDLVIAGKTLLGDDKDPQMQAINQLFDGIRIAAQANDVALSLSVPKELIDRFSQSKKAPTMSTNDRGRSTSKTRRARGGNR